MDYAPSIEVKLVIMDYNKVEDKDKMKCLNLSENSKKKVWCLTTRL